MLTGAGDAREWSDAAEFGWAAAATTIVKVPAAPSRLLAVLAARDARPDVTEPELVVASTAHAAFHKAAHLFGITLHKTPVRDDWTADVEAMAEHVNANTVLIVGSAPQYPQGVMDPIPEIAALAASVDAISRRRRSSAGV